MPGSSKGTGLLSSEFHGRENISRGNIALTLRIVASHGIALRYVASQGNASYSDVDYHHQTVGTLRFMYVLLGPSGFGAVEWRLQDKIVRIKYSLIMKFRRLVASDVYPQN